VRRLSLRQSAELVAYCAALFFLPFGLGLFAVDIVGGTRSSLPWLTIGLAAGAASWRSTDPRRLAGIVLWLAAVYSVLVLAKAGVDCYVLEARDCPQQPAISHLLALGSFAAGYAALGWLLIRRWRAGSRL